MATQAEVDAFNAAVASGNFGAAADIAAGAGYGAADVEAYIEANAGNLGFAPGTDIPSDVVASYFSDAGGGGGAGYVDQQAVDMLGQFDDRMLAGDYNAAALLLDQAAAIYGDETFTNVANYLNTDPKYAGLRQQVGGALYTPENLKEFIASAQKPPVVKPEEKVPTVTQIGSPTPGLTSIPRQQAQTPSMITFAPLQRGLGQLRPAAFMPGLLEGRPGFGGSGFIPEQIGPRPGPTFKDTSQLGAFNLAIAQGDFERGAQIAQAAGFSPQEAEYYINANLSGLNLGEPVAPGTIGSLYGPNAPTPPGLALQTGAYGPTIPTSVAIPQPSSATAPQPGSSFEDQMGYLSNLYLGRPLTAPELATYRTDFGGTLNQANITDFLNRSQQEMANRLLVGTNPESVTNPTGIKEGGMIKMAEGGMPKASAQEAGSKFDIAEFIDDEGRLVQGYNRPIYEDNVLVGYEFEPYQRDVVFNPRLRERESSGSSGSDLEMAMRAMIARQGRTGVSPTMGGLAGIMPREPVMRRRPDYNFAEGGLASVAQDLADKGRFGDTMVAHISPQEAGLLKAMGGSGTINPETGLPEFFSLFPKKGIKLNLGPLGNIKFGKKSSDLIQAAAALYAGSYLPGGLEANLGKTALTYGGVRAAATGNLQEGIMAGLTAYGMGNLYTSFGPGATTPTPTPTEGTGSLSGGPAGVTSANVPIQGTEAEFLAARPEFGQATTEALSGMATELPETTLGVGVGDPSSMSALELAETGPTAGNTAWTPPVETAPPPADYSKSFGRFVPEPAREYVPDFVLEASTPAVIGTTVLGTSLIGGQQQRSAYAAQQAAAQREKEERRRRGLALFQQTLGAVPVRQGGLMKLAGGGMTYMEAGGTTGPTGEPRDVTGTGDGMSDSVPASIEGVQEARLADGEFVIPADVVADIGNGSSDAGSKKLYDMMDRIRMARHGTKEQPPEIKAERLMPA